MQQQQFDFGEIELANLKRRIDELDPVAQALAVVKHLDDYTQKELGEKLGKTRDWVAKRVQFISALRKLSSDKEREDVKELVRQRTSSMDVVIAVVDLSKEQRWEIFSKHPTVEAARRLVNEYHQNRSPEAKLKVLEGELPKAYIELEGMVEDVIRNVALSHASCGKSLSVSLSKQVEIFIDDIWHENRRFGPKVWVDYNRTRDAETLKQRIAWLELSETERTKILQPAIADCHNLTWDMMKELESQATQVPFLTKQNTSLQAEIALLRLHVKYSEMQGSKSVGGVSINFGNGLPSLNLNIAGDQLKVLYRALSLAFHPDKHPEGRRQYEEAMKVINAWMDKVDGKT